MSVIKCKMCGGTIEFEQGATVGTCEYCGSKQTLPNADDEKKVNLFNRANRLRMACEFDKAAGIYEQIIAEFPEEAEAYWGLCLANYGIEYVDDPATANKIPTCHRASFDKMRKDENYELAIENADMAARLVYEEQAKEIDRIMGEILKVSRDEQPYDIFICYKETNSSGSRTPDSVLAQDIYDALTGKGYRTFFSRITLEDKLGTQYEPYIFSALNSAKMMLVVGTDYEYMNAVWVKNEWSRFIKLMAKDKTKVLIPCYRDMDPYDMPDEFKVYQSQDCGKLGFMQDLLRGIDKILGKTEQSKVVEKVVAQQGENNATVSSLLERVFMFLEDGEWVNADKYCEKVLDINPKNGEAYLGKLMAEFEVSKLEEFKDRDEPFDESDNYKKLCKFDKALGKKLYADINYNNAKDIMDSADTEEEFKAVADTFAKMSGYKDADSLFKQCIKKAEECRIADEKKFEGRRDFFKKTKGIISAKNSQTVGLTSKGSVIVLGETVPCGKKECHEYYWQNTVAIAAGDYHAVGLKADGTVVATGNNEDGQCDVEYWKDIVDIAAGDYHTVGLKADGTVVATGRNEHGQCDVEYWKDIVAIAAGYRHTIGLKADGTVVAVGDTYKKEDIVKWKNIVAIAAGFIHTIGLKANGTVVAAGPESRLDGAEGECYVYDWKDIVAIAAGYAYTVGLKADGTVVATGRNEHGQCDVENWKLFDNIDTFVEKRCNAIKIAKERRIAGEKAAEERRIAEKKAAEERRIAEEKARQELMEKLKVEKANAENELANLHGLFTGKRRKELEAQIAEIDKKLRNLNKS